MIIVGQAAMLVALTVFILYTIAETLKDNRADDGKLRLSHIIRASPRPAQPSGCVLGMRALCDPQSLGSPRHVNVPHPSQQMSLLSVHHRAVIGASNP